MSKQVNIQQGGFDSGDSLYLGSDDRRRIFSKRPLKFKMQYYRNVLTAFCGGWISFSSFKNAMLFPYSALACKKGSGMVLVCPEALDIAFGESTESSPDGKDSL